MIRVKAAGARVLLSKPAGEAFESPLWRCPAFR